MLPRRDECRASLNKVRRSTLDWLAFGLDSLPMQQVPEAGLEATPSRRDVLTDTLNLRRLLGNLGPQFLQLRMSRETPHLLEYP